MGYPLPHDTRAILYQNDKAIDNEHLINLFICYLHRFLLRMLHRLLTMVMLQVSNMIRHGLGVGVCSMENKKILPHEHKQAKIYLLDCSNESIRVLTLKDSKAVNESRFSWVM